LLARLKFLRGTPFDLFGWTAERRMERALVDSYFDTIEELAASLDPENHALAVEIASLPERIRGFGYIKEENVAQARQQEKELLDAWRSPDSRARAA
jgi:indolepyruvate ferredoxin oxidoreductase